MKEMKKTMQRVAVTWEMCGYINVEAESIEKQWIWLRKIQMIFLFL